MPAACRSVVLLVPFVALILPGGHRPDPLLVPAPHGDPLVLPARQLDPLRLVQRHIEAFNRRDLEAMAENVDEDFELYYVEGGRAERDLQGPDELQASMSRYFSDFPDARASLDEAVVNGAFVAVEERVTWTSGGERREQSSLAVYEIRDGRIRRTWYFPAQ